VRQLADLLGGTVDPESGGENLGATFTVKLPLMVTRPIEIAPPVVEERVHPTARASASVAHVVCPKELQGLHVLVVDDDEEARKLIRVVLEGCESRVSTATSATEALALLQSVRPDVLLSDIGMPTEDGYSLIRKVRELPAESGGQTPAAALTAYARMEDRLEALRSGFQIHLPKPIEPAELVVVVANLSKRSL
jgi:CheY-like chemotaxis protein